MSVDASSLPRLRRLRELLELAGGGAATMLPHQRPPDGDWRFWLLQAGRGAGKTLAICKYLVDEARRRPGLRARIIGPTEGDAIESCVEGPSGVQALAPEVKWRPSAPGGARLVWPNGSVALVLGTPTRRDVARLRASGNRHLDVWEELAANPMLAEAWPQAQLGLRLGSTPRTVAATTPVPSGAYRRIVAEADHVTRASIDDNPHLDETWRDLMRDRYAGTSLGAQELSGDLLDAVEGALWRLDGIDRVAAAPDLRRVAVAVDPSGSEDGDEQGIVAVGLGHDRHLYVLADRSCSKSPDGWAREVARLVDDVQADVVVWESNYGGDMVKSTLEAANLPVPLAKVNASRGKDLRAAPVALLYERQLVHHVGVYPRLEGQMTLWVPGDKTYSPDRLDALVFACTHLAPQATKPGRVKQPPAEWPSQRRSVV